MGTMMKGKLMSDKWFKYTFLCLSCDALYEISSQASLPNCFDPICSDMECPGLLNLVSVVDVTIPTIQPAQPKENIMDTNAELYNPQLLVTYKKVAGTLAEYVTEKVTDLEWTLDQARKSIADRTLFENQRFLIDNIINSSYEDSEDKDTLQEIAMVLGISLTKEVSWTATVTISGTMDVDLFDKDIELESEVSDEISGSLYDYDYSIDNVEEN